jgi:hypothetical protein
MTFVFFPLALIAAQPVAATSPFTGAWMLDQASMNAPPEITTLSLRDGVFSRGDPSSGFSVKADGRVHRIARGGYVDAVSITLLGPRRVREVDRLGGKVIYTVTYDLSVDGRTLRARVVDFGKPDGKPIPTTIVRVRVGRAAAGGSRLSGRWQTVGVATTRGHRTDTFRLAGGRFSVMGPGGYGYEAVIGGPPVPVRGDLATAQSAVTMPDDHVIVEHNFVDGVPTYTKTMTLLPDGRTIRVVGRREGETRDMTWLLRRQ